MGLEEGWGRGGEGGGTRAQNDSSMWVVIFNGLGCLWVFFFFMAKIKRGC